MRSKPRPPNPGQHPEVPTCLTPADLTNRPEISSIVDKLKFRIVCKDGKHYFTDVRFGGNVPAEIRDAVTNSLEGQCLESLSREDLTKVFGWMHCLKHLQKYVADLRDVFCD